MSRSYIVRRPRNEDIPEFRNIAESYPDNPLVDKFETAAVVESKNKVFGFGVTRTLLEAVLYTNASKIERTIALKELLNQASSDAVKMGFDQLYVFADEQFAEILKSHFNFTPAKGICLVKNLGE